MERVKYFLLVLANKLENYVQANAWFDGMGIAVYIYIYSQ